MERELKKLLKDPNLASKNKRHCPQGQGKSQGHCTYWRKIDKVSAKALMAKMPDTPKITIKRLINVQKTVVEGLQFKSFALSAPSVWVDDPEMYAHLKTSVIKYAAWVLNSTNS
ncbi:hypothetical protein DSO57_1005484 [Entomophthora muscae]|uniref:Uncharacterized protein n=1 Tax=Entomophthora muscae TaxID=34485 RepID=A0ACC2U5Z3_9FUNG|nr:hypothetical protein DSO57_1005484 [Entomophthora muscae]